MVRVRSSPGTAKDSLNRTLVLIVAVGGPVGEVAR